MHNWNLGLRIERHCTFFLFHFYQILTPLREKSAGDWAGRICRKVGHLENVIMENNLRPLLPVALFVSCAAITCGLQKNKKTQNKLVAKATPCIDESSISSVKSVKTSKTSATVTPDAPDCNDCSLADSAPKVDRHLLICGKLEDTNWPKKIEKEKDTFACALASALAEAATHNAEASPFNVKMTACNEPNTLLNYYDIIVYPEKIRYSVPAHDLDCVAAFAHYVSQAVLPLQTSTTSTDTILPPGVIQSPHALPWETLLLVCTHGNRDKRCGRAGPLILEALEADLAQRDPSVSSKIAVRASSHIGGHRYAGTLIVYPQGQWYGYMTKKNVKPLLDSVLAGGVLEKCFRGLGNISW